ncbi:small subunit processome component 20 homolog [Mya arenaria]|uniref:small subunit processome component 20 homolog n=1 Tax=Mya arenaria TaxID=6604 RepID=UPI0022E7D8AB|nr:small subunit processome component 20 homolog [Mya arenaria]
MGKSGRHKTENTFRFQTFSERIKNINIDVIHQIRHHDDTPEETETYFGLALQKQSELNCTEYFVNFQREISQQVKTFNQLVHHEEELVSALKKHLLVPNSMAIPALLHLLVQLARDLQSDFYRHFHELFEILVQVLGSYSRDVEVLEATFSCLSYLFKFLWRYLLSDVKLVYGYFSSLLSQQYKEYVRNFAAESFAFLMRKSKQPSELFDFMFKSLEKEPDTCEGVGRLMFEMMKGVKEQFHSSTTKVFPVLLQKLGPKGKQKGTWLPWQLVEESLTTTVISMATHASKEHLADIWDMIMAEIASVETHWQSMKKGNKTMVSETLERLLRLLNTLIKFRAGKLLSKPNNIAKAMLGLLQNGFPVSTGQVILTLISDLLTTVHSRLHLEVTAKLMPAVFKTGYPAEVIYTFTRTLFNLPLFERDVLPNLLKYTKANMDSPTPQMEESTLTFITDLLIWKCPLLKHGGDLLSLDTYMLDFTSSPADSGVPAYISSILQHASDWESIPSCKLEQSKLWAALICLPHVRPIDKDQAVLHVSTLLKTLMDFMSSETGPSPEESWPLIGCQALVSMVMLLGNSKVFDLVPVSVLTKSICVCSSNVHILRLADVYLTHAVNEGVADILTPKVLLDMFPRLQDNLSAPNSVVRHLSLRILASFNLQLPPSEVESTVGVFEICLSAETTPLSVQEYREKQRHLQRLEFSIVQNSIPAGPFAQVPLRYLLGNLFVNFKLLWEPIRLLISSHAQNMEREAFWEVVGSHLEMAAEKCEHQLSDRDSPRATNDSDTENPSPTEGITALMSQSLASLSLEESAPPNYTNFRDQLWQTLNMFSEKCAAKTRLLTPLLFRFLKNEYYLSDLSSAPSQNVLRKDKHTAKHNLSDRELDSEERMDVQEGKSRKRTRTAKNGNEGNKKPRTQKVSENVDTNLDVEKVIHTRIRTRSQCDSSTDINNELVNITNEDNESESARTNASDSPEKQSVVTHRVRTRSMTSVDGNSEMEDYSTPRKSSNRSRTRGDTSNNEKDTPTEGSTSKRVHRVGNRHMTSQSESEMETDSSPSMRNLRSKRMTTKSSNATDPEGDTSDSGLDEDTDMSDAEVTTEENVKNPKSKRLSAIKEYEDVNDSVSSNSVEGVTDEKNNKLETVKTNTESPKKSGVTQGLGKNAREGEGKGEVTESKKRGKAATSSLVVQLQLFSKFKDPHSVYREPELRKLYFDLLIHKNADVQKTAFKCIMTYKYGYLVPYRENFERLLDDKTFKNEIVLFSISQENSVVSPEHRPDLLPVLMRILYGKMHVKTGKGTSGKQHSHVRQSIILGFLNGCQHEELEVFIDLVFAPFKSLITDNPVKMVRHIQANTDLTSVLPVKKMQGALGSIEMIFKKLGHLMDVFLPSVIQMIVGMATMCGVLLGNRDNIVPHVINPLKSIRQNALYRLMQLFKNYDKYPWRPVEVDAVFESAVWPQLANLSFEGVYHPTPLLKLLHCWTNNPRYFPLLAKHHKDNPELSPLPHVIKLLLNPDCGVPVCIKIMEMVDNLLREYDPEQEIRFIETTDITQLPSIEGPDASLGVSLLQPHVSNILVYIQRYVTEFFATYSKKHSTPGKELNILSRLSQYVENETQSVTLVGLLLPFLNPSLSRNERTETDILTSMLNLITHISDPAQFFFPISKLFASIQSRNSRILLAQIFIVVCRGDEELERLAAIVEQLNSWDETRTEEPDYTRRLEGYRAAMGIVKAMMTMEIRVCLTLLTNCCYFISTVDDMSLRDSSTLCVVTIISQFTQTGVDEKAYNTIIMTGLMPEMRGGLRHKSQTVLHEFVTILAALVDTFGDQSTFEDLKPLRDKDVEADFFENLKHIQVYKRSRALRRLIKYVDTNTVKNETINNIFLPLVSSFLTDDLYKKHTTVQDAAVDAIGVICRVLPWKLYATQLKFYLKLLPKCFSRQKLLVRVIVSIMDNFHFDLSQSTLDVKNTPVPKVERPPPEEKKNTTVAATGEEKDPNNLDSDEDDVEVAPEINEAVEEEVAGKSIQGKLLCTPKLATTIHEVILKQVVAQLHKILIQKNKNDEEHKVNKTKVPEDEEILRVPIALAMVKLLQNLPKGAVERYLPGILLKVCNFLKSRSPDVRNSARETLVKIQSTLGPRFFPFILSELRSSLRRGYQRHVLCYTVFMLLKHMEESVRPGDIDVCLNSLQQVSNEEIFGEVSDEKDIDGIKSKVFEARSSKSYESYEFMARYISTGSLMKLMGPIKQILETSYSHRSARKVGEVLRKVTIGLLDNKNITTETLLVFIHGLTSDTLPQLNEKKKATVKKEEKPGQRPPSCLLLQSAAPRGGAKPRTNKKTNKHVLVEFGLHLLGQLLRKQRVVAMETSHLQMLDPLVPMMADCLHSKYIMVNANCLRVLCHILRFPLPSLEQQVKDVAGGMFVLLRNYATAGAAKGDNKELITMLFKAVTVLVREVKTYTLETGQLQVLLTFCDEDIHDHTRQSTAFSLLKAILSRKLDVPELHELIKKVREMSISAESPHVQRECRQAVLQYMLDYPLGKQLDHHLQFYVAQLSYEVETGRESTLEMLAAFFSAFPQKLLSDYSGLFFLPLAASLVNDESAKCRRLIALAIKSLLGKLDHNARSNLFSHALKWFMDSKLKLRILAAQLCGLFVEVEGGQFESRLTTLLPMLDQHLEPGKYTQHESAATEHDQDLMIYQVLNTLLKTLRECGQVLNMHKHMDSLNNIWEYVESYLSHAHNWVQLAACQLYGILFAAWQPEQLVAMEIQEPKHYLARGTKKKLKSLAIDFVTQLQSEYLTEELASQIIKNLVFIARCANLFDLQPVTTVTSEGQSAIPSEEGAVAGGDRAGVNSGRDFSVLWLVRKMTREAHHEAITNNKKTIKRTHVFKWLAAVSMELGSAMDVAVLRTMIPPLQREINDTSNIQDAALKSLANEVVELLKKTVGVETFTEVYANTQRVRAGRRDQRKSNKAIQAVANPEIAAKRKLKKNLAKIAAKKRKVEHLKPSKKTNKRKYKTFAITE